MNGPDPRVSVLLTVYNGMPWLPIAVESILSQTLTDFEVVIVDDGSTDGSGEVCDAYAARDGRLRVLHQANAGQVTSLNRGLAQARGAYVARLDADDLMYPSRLATQVAFLDAHPDVALVGSQVDWAAPWGTSLWETPTVAHVARWTLLVENCFMHGGVTFRSSVVRALGGYDDGFATAEDYDLWLRISRHHDVLNLPKTLSWFNHLRSENISTVQSERQENAAFRLMRREIGAVLPDATDEEILDLYFVGRGRTWPDAPAGTARRQRLARAARMLVRLHDAFLRRGAVPAADRPAIRADRDRRLMRIRTAFAGSGGAGRLARLYRPLWDRRARLLQLSGRLP